MSLRQIWQISGPHYSCAEKRPSPNVDARRDLEGGHKDVKLTFGPDRVSLHLWARLFVAQSGVQCGLQDHTVEVDGGQAAIFQTVSGPNNCHPVFEKALQHHSPKAPMSHDAIRMLFEIGFLMG